MSFNSRNNNRGRNVFVDMTGGNLQVSLRGRGGGGGGGSNSYSNNYYRDDSRNRDDGSSRGSRGSRMPEGHWRGNSRGGGGGGRGGGMRRGQIYYGDLIQSSKPDRPTERMEMWRGRRGGRRGRDNDRYKLERPSNRMELSLLGWQKIIVQKAAQHEPTAVIAELQQMVGEKFDYSLLSCDQENITFFLEDNTTLARSLADLSKRFAMPGSNQRLSIITVPITPPFPPPTVDNLIKVKAVLGQRYSEHMKRLDISQFHQDPNFKSIGLLFPLYTATNLSAVGRLISENILDVTEIDMSKNKIHNINGLCDHIIKCKQLNCLNLMNNKIANKDRLLKLKGSEITELNLIGNPLLHRYKKSPDVYISDMRAIFPKLLILDGKELPRAIGFDVEDSSSISLPPVCPSFTVSEDAKGRIGGFLTEYFKEIESSDISRLKAAYCEDAIFSVSMSGDVNNDRSYDRIPNRNLKTITDSEVRVGMLYRGRDAVIDVLKKVFGDCVEHDKSSFIMDIPLDIPNKIMKVIISGVFRKTGSQQQSSQRPKGGHAIKFFQRSLIIVPQGNGHCIANEQLYITNPTSTQIKLAFQRVPSTTTAGSQGTNPVGLEPRQLQMIEEFSKNSNLKPEFCKECLENSGWDFSKAGQLFMTYKNEGKIPANCFIEQS